MKNQITVRDFSISEYESLIELYQKAGLPHRPEGRDSRQNIAAELERKDTCILLAECGRIIAGSVVATCDGRKGWINRLAVSPQFRGEGIAGLLVDEAEKRLISLGVKIFSCLILTDNAASMRVFE